MRVPTLLLVSITIPATIAVQTSGTFSILSFNVAGLPSILNDNDVPGDKTDNAESIGTDFAKYNYSLIHVQEDFNYHAYIYANDDHPYRTATSGGVPFGSGLNSLSNYNWTDFTRIKWNTCSDASGADCLTPKGFTAMRLHIAEGVSIDAYNLHADAGTETDDLTARAANLQQVSDYIQTYSIGNPVLVFGDSNSRYTRTADIPAIFTTNNMMTDAWVQLVKGGVAPAKGAADLVCDNPSTTTACEVVDKVWYRGSSGITLQATTFNYVGDMFLQANGSILSDHNPVNVDFSWSLSSTLRLSDPFGGDGGDWYNDLSNISSIASPKVSSITVQGANRLDAVSVTLSSGQTFTHGGTGGTASTLTLSSGETLTSALLCEGSYNGGERLFYAQFTTSSGRTVSAGTQTSDCVTQTAASGWSVVGFVGRSGDEVDRLGLVYAHS